MKNFSITEAVKFAWHHAIDNIGFFVVFLTLYLIIDLVNSGLTMTTESMPLLAFFFSASLIIDTFVGIVMTSTSLRVLRGERAHFDHLFANVEYFWRYLWGSILYGLIVLGGFLLLVAPGVIWSLRFSFYTYFIIDRKMTAMEALKASYHLTAGKTVDLIGLSFILLFLLVSGFLALIVGLYVAIPLTMLASVHVYQQLLAEPASPRSAKPRRRRKIAAAKSPAATL